MKLIWWFKYDIVKELPGEMVKKIKSKTLLIKISKPPNLPIDAMQSNQNLTRIFSSNWQEDFKICLEKERTKNSQNKFNKEQQKLENSLYPKSRLTI